MKNIIIWILATIVFFIGLMAASYYFKHDLREGWTVIAMLIMQINSVPALLSWVKTFKEILK